MKKFIIILIIILFACIGVGVFFGIKSCEDKSKTFDTSISILQKEYTVGEKIYFEYVIYSDIKLKSVTYELNNGGETSIGNARIGEVSSLEGTKSDRMYYLDTRVIEVETTEFSSGWYTLSFYGYDDFNNRYELTKEPYSFKLTVKQ